MNTERLGSGPSLVGISPQTEARNRKMDAKEKVPESFADLVAKKATEKQTESKAAQKPDTGRSEAGSRTSKDLSVRRKDEGERKDVKQDSDQEPTQKVAREKEDKHDEVVHKSAKPKASLTPKQKAMQEFMDSVESEFSIPPERIVVAMAQLSDKEMLKSPEETASQIISKLNLTPEQSEQAEAHYMSMLNQLRVIDNRRPEKMFEPTPEQAAWIQAAGGMGVVGRMAEMKNPAEGQLPVAVMTKDRRSALEDSLSRLSQKFFLSPSDKVKDVIPNAESMALQQDEQGMLNQMGMKNEFANSLAEAGGALDYSNLQNMPNVKPDISQVPQHGMAEQSLQNRMAMEDSYRELATKLSAVSNSAVDVAQAMKLSPENRMALKMEQGLNQLQNLNGPNMMPMAVGGNASMQGYNFEGSGSDGAESGAQFGKKDSLNLRSVDKAEGKASEFFMQPLDDGKLALRTNDFSAATAARGAADKVNVVHSPDQTQNIQQVMNQAQLMIRKGGGDAIVKLNPEGLGEIHLRVSVNEGKVNLQMSAETKEAKNLIESSLKDLKASLGAHDLKVEQVKVNVGNHSSSENNNSQKDASDGGFKFDQQREQARQFLGNFREENSANRGGYFDMPGLKAYNTHKGPEPLKPSTDPATSSRRYTGEGRGNGLNLVV